MVDENVVNVNESLDDIDLSDLDLGEGVDVIEEVDPIEAELTAKTEKPKKEKKAKAEGEGKSKALADDEVGAAYVAELCGVDQRVLRGFLRKNYRNMNDDKSKRYVWKKDDPQIQEIVDAYKAAAAAPRKVKKAETTEEVAE